MSLGRRFEVGFASILSFEGQIAHLNLGDWQDVTSNVVGVIQGLLVFVLGDILEAVLEGIRENVNEVSAKNNLSITR